ncbi:MAG: hypothetical protein A3J63_01740 [Candidatus Moranbacteria bacterium RIFCSPHIGHO2_02_FULL_40_12b]|nr:MAG: hypothetical protein A3J63_01740 [Candidatus Moranbacteria bacterium RIFCSPHIGHO2_02_FULL_40_12b]OGI24097.1 MAG: hypothetical protein A3E91_01215 [Candidatus Moranbacteria bacterium RIFCSPHIGHO2_12_FULL_40_10]
MKKLLNKLFKKDAAIAATLAIFMLSCLLFLGYIEYRQQNPDLNKNWWVLYFENSKDGSMAFAIENHGNIQNFHWEIFSGKNKPFLDGTVEVKKGEIQKINPVVSARDDRSLTIRVSDGENKKEIYKIFEK